ncbi:MAG TPA: hypothetical protein PKD54_09885 [Pirellulaceae bacterium]|nr:hypothetical protein [Pirellulaceae bacterium]
MQLLINHLTRMQPGWICTAGIDLKTGRHIRPLDGNGLPNTLLDRNGGPLQLGVVVNLGPSEFCGTVPEIEDRKFQIQNLTVVHRLSAEELFRECEKVAQSSLRAVFSDDLEWLFQDLGSRAEHHDMNAQRSWGTAAIAQHRGIRSLGCYWAQSAQLKIIVKEGRPRVRLRFVEGDLGFDVPVTDYRLFLTDQVTPDEPAIAEFNANIANQTRTLVAIGLSRAYRHSDNQPARHWLQVNNILTVS